jgi:mannose-6-phosphate isomerase-like protein (cupin superfamily)
MVEEITYQNELLAIIVRESYKREGISFFTPHEFSQQIAYMNHPPGKVIDPHVHNQIIREVYFTQEVLFLKRGKIRVDFYNSKQDYLESRILVSGDMILLASGGHGFEVIEEIEMIEIKQGPYAGDEDKVRFRAVDQNNIKIS